MFRIKMALILGLFSFVFNNVINTADQQLFDTNIINKSIDSKTSVFIPNASYAIYTDEGTSFYTFDGNLLGTIPQIIDTLRKKQLLDKAAPKPRPIAFEIKRVGASQKAIAISAGIAGIVNFFSSRIVFYDKNGNIFGYFYYGGPIPATRESLKELEKESNLDLSGIIEDRTWLWFKPLTWFKRFKISTK